MHLRRPAVGFAAVFIFACSCDDGGTGPDARTIVTIAPAVDTLNAIGDTSALSATVEEDGAPVDGASPVWSSLDTLVAVVETGANVVSVSNGTARVVARAAGAADTAIVLVRQVAAQIRPPSPTDSIVPGDSVRFVATAVDSNGVAIDSITEFDWASSDEAVASTDATGSVFGHATGTVAVRVSHEELVDSIVVTVDWLRLATVSTGGHHACGLTAGGDAYCWGQNLNGQLGDGTTTDRRRPVRVGGGLALSAIDAGNWHACGVTHQGQVYCWGSNTDGQLGRESDELNLIAPVPVAIEDSVTAITAGGVHTCALASGGAVYCWGGNGYGELGNGTNGNAQFEPVRVIGDVTFASVTAGAAHTCGLTAAGEAYCWGYNALGQLGLGSTGDDRDTPTPVTGGITFTVLAAGGGTCGVADDGTAYCWGVDNHGEVGDGPDTSECMIETFSHSCRAEPSALDAQLTFARIDHGAGGNGGHGCAISTAGDGYCWGIDFAGKIGDGGQTGAVHESPQSVAGAYQFASVSAGLDHSCAIATDGLTYCWGGNHAGQLGDGTESPQAQPVLVARQQP